MLSTAGDNKGHMFYATAKGVAYFDEAGKTWKYVNTAPGRSAGKINALYYDGNMLWAGGDNNALFIIDPQNLSSRPLHFSEITNISINSITGSTRAGEVYVNTNLEGVFIFSDYKLKINFSVKNSLLHNNVFYSYWHNNRVYYATHNTAINFSENAKVFEIGIKDQGLISDFNCYASASQASLVIGTNGDGVYFLNDNNIIPMPENRQLSSKYCNAVCFDRAGNLWIALRYALYKYYPSKQVLKKINIEEDENRLFNLNAFYADSAGQIYFGTSKNVVKLNSLENSSALPKTYITGFTLADSLYPLTAELALDNGKYDIGVHYSALCLGKSEEVYYRYMLEGRDSKWSEPTQQRRADFAGLGEGTYTFKVKAFTGDGLSLEQTAEFIITIKPPIWKTIWFWAITISLIFTLMFAVIRIRTAALVKAKIRLEKLVDEKTIELRREKELVEAKNHIIGHQNAEIKSSITYARRIQEAILPEIDPQRGYHNRLLILYRPKDIVSGDFYWIAEKDKRLMVAACDCTGHGVPGAFMSMIGSTLLNKIVFDKGEADPAIIMREMDTEVSGLLHQESNEVNDGMESGLCSIHVENGEVLYAGAKRPLFLYRKKENGYELEEFKADKFPIGGFAEIKDKQFKTNRILTREGDMLYMFSDGVIDQFSPKNRRIGTKQVRELLSKAAAMGIEEQKAFLEQFIDKWRGTVEQTDDILLLGFRL